MIVQARHNIREKKFNGLLHLEISPGRKYKVVSVESDYYRILNDNNEPYLYPKEMFVVLDNAIPQEWIQQYYADGECYIGPKEFSTPGFFEDFFDGRDYAKKLFLQIHIDEMF